MLYLLVKYSGCTRSKNITKTMKENVNNSVTCRRSLLIALFSMSGNVEFSENGQPQSKINAHSCCDMCAKSCKCLCSCQDVCSCDITNCNSESFFSPMEMLTMDRNTTTKGNYMLHDGNDTPIHRRCARDELLHYHEKLANEYQTNIYCQELTYLLGFQSLW